MDMDTALQELLAEKTGEVQTVTPEMTVSAAVELINARKIGSVLVMDGGRLVGIFTERDVLRRVVAEGRDPAATALREVMTTALVTCGPDTGVDTCAAVMTERRLRHLPVVDDRGLCGLVTIGDLLAFQVGEQQATIEELHRYVFDVRLPAPAAVRADAP